MAKELQEKKRAELPVGWCLSGSRPQDYEAGIDSSTAHSGTRSAYLKHAVENPKEFSTLMQEFSPEEYLGKRLRMSAWLKTTNVADWASLWLSVYGKEGRINVSFDNMCNRKIIGTNDWTKCQIVLEIPTEATKLGFGAILGGKGELWVDDYEFDVVDDDVPVTDCPCSERNRGTPRNLDFESA